MKIIKLNRKHSVNSDNIEKIIIKPYGATDHVWIYRKEGYPKIYITSYNFYQFRLKCTNLGLKMSDFIIEDLR